MASLIEPHTSKTALHMSVYALQDQPLTVNFSIEGFTKIEFYVHFSQPESKYEELLPDCSIGVKQIRSKEN